MVTVPSDTSTVDSLLDRTVTKFAVDKCSAAASMILYYDDLRKIKGRQSKVGDAYVWPDDAVRCLDYSNKTLRDLY